MAFISTIEVKNKTTDFKYRRAIFGYSIGGEDSEKYIEGLDVKFEVVSAGGQILPSARIDICNLDTNLMKKLVTITPFDNEHRVALYVGYETNYNGRKNTFLPKIFEGQIQHAMFTYIPDVWLQMSCVDRDNSMVFPLTQDDCDSVAEAKIKSGMELLKWIVNEKLKMPLSYNEKDFRNKDLPPILFNAGKEIFQYNIGGKSSLELLKELEVACNIKIFLVGDTFIVSPNDRYIDEAIEKPAKWKVNVNTGMIGIPTVSVAAAEVKVLMNPNIMGNDSVDLQSKMYNNVYVEGKEGSSNAIAANGIYTVTGVTHRGHLRGNEWYSTLRMVRGGY